MSPTTDGKSEAEVRALLDQLPGLYFSILKNAQIEEGPSGTGVRCTLNIPVVGTRVSTAGTAREAIRETLLDLAAILAEMPVQSLLNDWQQPTSSVSPIPDNISPSDDKSTPRYKAKARQMTIGVTMPVSLKSSLDDRAATEKTSFAALARQLVSVGFEDFDERSFHENSNELLSKFSNEVSEWHPSKNEQVMVRLDQHLAVRLRTSAKEYGRSASEFGAMCLAHGFSLHSLLLDVEEKVSVYVGPRIRKLSSEIDLEIPTALLSSVLAGTISAPTVLLKRLSDVFGTSEFALASYFKRSFESRAVPAFKAEGGKPLVALTPTSWEQSVRSLKLPPDQTEELLKLDGLGL